MTDRPVTLENQECLDMLDKAEELIDEAINLLWQVSRARPADSAWVNAYVIPALREIVNKANPYNHDLDDWRNMIRRDMESADLAAALAILNDVAYEIASCNEEHMTDPGECLRIAREQRGLFITPAIRQAWEVEYAKNFPDHIAR